MLNNYLKLLPLMTLIIINREAFSFCDTSMPNRYPTVEREFETSKMVIDGVVLSKKTISTPDDPIGYVATLYTVKPLHVFKGNKIKEITLYSENTSARFPMGIGKRYIIFAQTSDDGLFIDNCGNSEKIKKSSKIISKVIALSHNSAKPKSNTN